jgi:hypothetical protein
MIDERSSLESTELDKEFAAFLKKQRGAMSYAEFSRKTGLTASSLFRLEQGQRSITLGRLHEVLKRLKMSLGGCFCQIDVSSANQNGVRAQSIVGAPSP